MHKMLLEEGCYRHCANIPDVKSGLGTRLQSKWGGSYIMLRLMLCSLIFRSSIVWTGVGEKSVSQAIDSIVSYTIYGQAMCPGGNVFLGNSVLPDSIYCLPLG